MNAPSLPPGRELKLPGRGTTFVRDAAGPPGAPVLLLLHGWTANADLNWFRCYEPLSRRFRVVAVDHRGHGRGIRSRRPFRLEDCADDAAAVCEVLGIDRVIPVGYSMGGPVAQLVWRRHRELVQGLVLCATSRNFGRGWSERAMFGAMLGLSGVARVAPPPLRRRVVNQVLQSRLEGSPLGDWAAAELGRNHTPSILEAGWAIGRFTSHEWIGNVDVPTGVVVTLDDGVVHPQRQMKLARAIPDAKVYPIHGDHGACVMAPRLFVPALMAAASDVAARSMSRAAAATDSP